MLVLLGYLINSVILLVLIVVGARIYIDFKKKDPEEMPIGHLVMELTDIIITIGRKFIPLKEDSILLIVIFLSVIIISFIVKAVII